MSTAAIQFPTPTSVASGLITIPSQILGDVSVPRQEIIQFPRGIFGFPECHSFALLPAPRRGIFCLQSIDFSALAFILADPFAYFPDHYYIELSSADAARLGSEDPKDILVLTIVTLPTESGGRCTANLQAPLLFNLRDRRAYQVIFAESKFGIREEFDLDAPSAATVV